MYRITAVFADGRHIVFTRDILDLLIEDKEVERIYKTHNGETIYIREEK